MKTVMAPYDGGDICGCKHHFRIVMSTYFAEALLFHAPDRNGEPRGRSALQETFVDGAYEVTNALCQSRTTDGDHSKIPTTVGERRKVEFGQALAPKYPHAKRCREATASSAPAYMDARSHAQRSLGLGSQRMI